MNFEKAVSIIVRKHLNNMTGLKKFENILLDYFRSDNFLEIVSDLNKLSNIDNSMKEFYLHNLFDYSLNEFLENQNEEHLFPDIYSAPATKELKRKLANLIFGNF